MGAHLSVFFDRGAPIRSFHRRCGSDDATDEAGEVSKLTSRPTPASRSVRELEAGNLVVPVVGDFGGAKAIRSGGVHPK